MIREAIKSLEKENEELMKDNTLAGSVQNQNQVLKYDKIAVMYVQHQKGKKDALTNI